ncbi:MAG: PLD nuclease N-terminal domain-containing protein [Aequorivita sp.]
MIFLKMIGPWQIVLILILLLLLVTPIIALVDILKSDFGGNDKIIWVIIVLLGSFVGALLYYLIGRKQKI